MVQPGSLDRCGRPLKPLSPMGTCEGQSGMGVCRRRVRGGSAGFHLGGGSLSFEDEDVTPQGRCPCPLAFPRRPCCEWIEGGVSRCPLICPGHKVGFGKDQEMPRIDLLHCQSTGTLCPELSTPAPRFEPTGEFWGTLELTYWINSCIQSHSRAGTSEIKYYFT